MLNVLTVALSVLAGLVLMHPRLSRARLWRATITPLASIIGSGFLVLGPILGYHFGYLAPLVMALLCAGAWLFGAAVRFNIAWLDRAGPQDRIDRGLETLGSWSLAFAYFVSVAYYLNLLGAFAVSLTPIDDPFHARLITSGVFAVILSVGWRSGFGALERMEEVSVGVKLSIIAGLLFALAYRFTGEVQSGTLQLLPPQTGGWAAITLVFGLLVTVQGFEISRYMGERYSAPERIRSMRYAQILSSAIYLFYIAVLTFIYEPDPGSLSETSIIDFTEKVAPILPVLLIAAALSAQFSAAVADTGGAGGLVREASGGRIPLRAVYGLLVGFGLLLTWGLSVFDIIGYASRAFAFYYAIQALIAARRAALRGRHNVLQVAVFALLAVLGAAIVLFGTSVE